MPRGLDANLELHLHTIRKLTTDDRHELPTNDRHSGACLTKADICANGGKSEGSKEEHGHGGFAAINLPWCMFF